MELADTVALVTGSGKRIGRAIALGLAEVGSDVAVHYNRSADAAGETAEQVRALSRRAEVFQADLAEPRQIAALLAAVGETFGRLDVLVNNAALYDRTPLDTLTAEHPM